MLNNTLYDYEGNILFVALIPPDMIYKSREKQWEFSFKVAVESGVDLTLLRVYDAECGHKKLCELWDWYLQHPNYPNM